MKKSTKIIAMFVAAALSMSALPIVAGAQNADFVYEQTAKLMDISSDGNWSYSVNVDGTVTIKGMYEIFTDVVIPSEIDGMMITAIGDSAFAWEDITSVIIPSTVKNIESRAFYNCKSLRNVTMEIGVTDIGDEAFRNCKSIENIVLADSVENIGDESFSGCSNLKSIELSSSLKTIGKNAFEYCENLESIHIPNGTTHIEEEAFLYCSTLSNITIPDSVMYIGKHAFEETAVYNDETKWTDNVLYINNHLIKFDMYNIDGYNIKEGTVSIAGDAFNFADLTYITIPDSVVGIGKGAFSYNSFTDVEIPDSVKIIGDEAFSNCTELVSVIIPDSVESVGNRAFVYCEALSEVELGKNISYMGSDIFLGTSLYIDKTNWEDNMLYIGNYLIKVDNSISGECEIKSGIKHINDEMFYGCTDITSIKIPDSVKSIGKRAFAYNTSLESIDFPAGLTIISESMFEGCESLVSIDIPDSVTTIGDSAFLYCEALEEIVLSKNIKYIEDSAFLGCKLLTQINIPSSVTKIGKSVFSGCKKLEKINVSSANENYCAEDGVLFDKNKNTLIWYAQGKNDTSYSIPESVTKIESSAISGCSNIVCVTVPASVSDIGSSVFYNCKKLTEIKVDKNNENYSSQNGILFSKEKDELLVYPAGKSETEYTLPDCVTSILDYAFGGCSNLSKIVILPNVEYISDTAFLSCSRNLVISGINESDAYYCAQDLEIDFVPIEQWTQVTVDCVLDDTYTYTINVEADNEVIPDKIFVSFKTGNQIKNFVEAEKNEDGNFVINSDLYGYWIEIFFWDSLEGMQPIEGKEKIIAITKI